MPVPARFDAKVVSEVYQPIADRANYWYHGYHTELFDGTHQNILYEKVPETLTPAYAAFQDFFVMWQPVERATVVNKAIPYICAFKGTDGLFDIIKDISIVRAYYTNNYFSTTGALVYQQLDALVALLKPLFEGANRAVHFVSHSLGSFMSNYVAWKLHSTSSSIRVSGLSQTMFAPLLLATDDYEYFRSINTHTPATYIDIHTCEGDMITGKVSSYGLGTVYRYSQSVSPINPNPAIAIQDVGYGAWLANILDYPAGSTTATIRQLSLGLDLHKLANFDLDQDSQGVPLGLTHITSNYDSIVAMGSYATHGISLQCQKQVDLSQVDGLTLTSAQLYLAPPSGSGDFSTDYPHSVGGTDQDDTHYRWSVEIITNKKKNYIKSMGETWVNFPLLLENHHSLVSVEATVVKETTAWSVIKPDQTIQYGQKRRVNITSLPIATNEENNPTQVAALTAAEQDRYEFNLITGLTHSGQRRTSNTVPALPPANPYTDTNSFRHHAWNQNITSFTYADGTSATYARGDMALITIKTSSQSTFNSNWHIFSRDSSNPTIYGAPDIGANSYGYDWGSNIDWTDNPSYPDTHTYLVYRNSNGTWRVVNSEAEYNSTPHYVGVFTNDWSTTNYVAIPDMEIVRHANHSNEWTLQVKNGDGDGDYNIFYTNNPVNASSGYIVRDPNSTISTITNTAYFQITFPTSWN